MKMQRSFRNVGRSWPPRLIDVYYCHEDVPRDQPKWMLMELAQFGDIDRFLDPSPFSEDNKGARMPPGRRGPFSEDVCRWILRQLLEALKAMHAIDYIHRDVKPGNMLLTCDGVIKLCDFGKATTVKGLDRGEAGGGGGGGVGGRRGRGSGGNTDALARRRATSIERRRATSNEKDMGVLDHMGQGTVRYRAPEAVFNPPVYSKAGDVWGCGVILLEAAAGGAGVSQDWMELINDQTRIEEANWTEQVAKHLEDNLEGRLSDDLMDIFKNVSGRRRERCAKRPLFFYFRDTHDGWMPARKLTPFPPFYPFPPPLSNFVADFCERLPIKADGHRLPRTPVV